VILCDQRRLWYIHSKKNYIFIIIAEVYLCEECDLTPCSKMHACETNENAVKTACGIADTCPDYADYAQKASGEIPL